jgi:hypothetical protein
VNASSRGPLASVEVRSWIGMIAPRNAQRHQEGAAIRLVHYFCLASGGTSTTHGQLDSFTFVLPFLTT